MLYALPVLTLLMLAYLFWSATFRLRRDRLRATRNSDRSHLILTPRQRLRANLARAFRPPERKAEWETSLLAGLGARD